MANPDRWATRDYPVLEWIVGQFDQQPHPIRGPGVIAKALGITEAEAIAAIDNLERGGYIDGIQRASGRHPVSISDITERALRETGSWPNEQAIADQLLWFLEHKVETADTDDERSRWRDIRDSIGRAGRDFTVQLAAAMATRTMGA